MSQPIPFYGDDLLNQTEAAALLGVKPAMVRKYMRKGGYEGKPVLPYVRFTRKPYFSRYQIANWLQRIQEQVDPLMIDVNRATREQST